MRVRFSFFRPSAQNCLVSLLGASFVLCFCQGALGQNESAQKIELAPYLDSAQAYCERIKNIALYYVAKERIIDKRYFYRVLETKKHPGERSATAWTVKFEPKGSKIVTLLYDYQLISKNGQYQEKRQLLEEGGKEKHEENAELKGLKFSSQYLVFGPVGFLSRYWQNHFSYEVIGTELVGKTNCIIIKATPKEPREENNNVGKVWLAENDSRVLRIEWEAKSILGYQEGKVTLPTNEMRRTVICRVEYDVEKNGVRFPGLQSFREVLLGEKPEDQVVLEEITYGYYDYKFFTVGVAIKY